MPKIIIAVDITVSIEDYMLRHFTGTHHREFYYHYCKTLLVSADKRIRLKRGIEMKFYLLTSVICSCLSLKWGHLIIPPFWAKSTVVH